MRALLAPPLRPDPHLPHRDRLLQESFVCEWLSQHLGSNGPIRVDASERLRVKYRIGESLRVVYRVRAGTAEATVALRMSRPGRSGSVFREASRTATTVDSFRGVGHAPELDTVFWTFPNDRKIADLALLHSPETPLARALGLTRVRTRLLGWAPEKSAAAACLADSGEVVGYAKVYAADEAPRVSTLYRDVSCALRRAGSGLRVPRLLAVRDSPHTLLFEAIAGPRLSHAPSRDRETGVERLGTALAAMHALPPPAATFTRLAPARLLEAARLIGQVRPDGERFARDLADELIGRAGSHCEPAVRLHGDVHPGNVILANGHVALIDLDQSAAGPAAADLGSFLAYLRSERTLDTLSPIDEACLSRAFLRGYATRRDLPHADSLRWHTAAALLAERALRAVNRFRPDSLARLQLLLSAATDILAGEGDA